MTYKLQDLIDMDQFQMLQDRLNEIYSFPSAIIDNQGNILTATAWQDICTKFHRQHKECEKECVKSDRYILDHIHEANPAVSYECPHGLIDNATPIMIDGVHYGNFFTGQFFLEKPNLDRFREQAKKYGFDEKAYLEAVSRVPIWTKDQLENYLFFIKGMIEVISGIGLKRLKELEFQKEIREINQFNEQIINNARDGVIVYGTDLKYKTWNPQMEKISGVPAHEVLGKHPIDVFPFLKNTSILDQVEKALRGESTQPVDFHYDHPASGASGWVSDTCGPLRNADGEIIGVIGIVREITERKQAEAAIQQSETRFRRLFEQSNDAVFIHDLSGRLFDVNDRACELMGYSRQDLLSLSLMDLHPRHVHAQVKKSIKLFREKGALKFESQFIKKDRRIVDVEISARMIEIEKEIVQGIVRDITDRKNAEQALRESEERFRSLFDNAPLGYQSLDENGNFLMVNQTWCRILGYTREEVIGRNFSEFIHPDFREVFKENFPKFKSMGYILGVEFEMLKKDGSEIVVSFEGKIGHDASGAFRQTHCVFEDVSKRKRAEAEKEKLQIQLLHSQKLQAVGQLASGVAHDFNNMLGVILGNAQLIKANSRPENPHSEEIEEIISAAQRSRDLTSKLLLFSRRDLARNLTVIQVGDAFQTIQGMLKRSAPQNITISSDIKSNCKIKCDVSQLNQALLNICINAIDAMPKGGHLRLICRREDPRNIQCGICGKALEQGYCVIEISDTGLGIPEEHINNIVEPFFTTKGVGKGTGLGLSVTHGIIHGHNGHMRIQSELGKGTSILIYLPLSEEVMSGNENVAAARLPAGKETIMVVDDEEGMLKMARKILEKAGYQAICFNNGKEAVARYREMHHEIDLVVLDMMMPDMDGAEVYGRFKQINEDVKILFASGQNISEEAESLFDKTKQKFIQKPYLMHKVLETIRELLDGAES